MSQSAEGDAPKHICWDEHGGLYLPPEYAYIGVAMDRRDAADEMQQAFDAAGRARRGEPRWPWEHVTPPAEGDHGTCGGCGHDGDGSDQVEWYQHTQVCPGLATPTP